MVLAHGSGFESAPSVWEVVAAWPVEPVAWLSLGLALWLYLRAIRRAGERAERKAAFLAGLGVCALALSTPIAAFAHELFWVHMVQHLLLTLIAAPLLALGAPVALTLRAAQPPLRRRLSAALHSKPARALSHPIVRWGAFALVMWATHFSPLYQAALEHGPIHAFEHFLYLSVAFLFWQPVVGADPIPGRLSHPARVGYLVAAIPQQSFLGLALYSAGGPLYRHYADLARSWGPTPLEDQTAAALIMWLGGDALLIGALVLALAAWMRAETDP